jgi:hypothetical protein
MEQNGSAKSSCGAARRVGFVLALTPRATRASPSNLAVVMPNGAVVAP